MTDNSGMNFLSSFPLRRNLLNSAPDDADRSYFNSDEPAMEHRSAMDALGGAIPTSEEIGARNQAALQMPAVPGYDPDHQQAFMPDRSLTGFAREGVTRLRDKYDALAGQFNGEGRREDGVEELSPGTRVGNQDTSAWTKMALGRGNDQAVLDIARTQLPGITGRKDAYGNAIVRLPGNAVRSDVQVTGYTDDGLPVFGSRDVPVGGQEYYPNRPGFSGRDVINAAVDSVPSLVGYATYKGVKTVTGSAPRAGSVGAAVAAGANVLLDDWARSVGSKQPIDYERASEQGRDRLIGDWHWF